MRHMRTSQDRHGSIGREMNHRIAGSKVKEYKLTQLWSAERVPITLWLRFSPLSLMDVKNSHGIISRGSRCPDHDRSASDYHIAVYVILMCTNWVLQISHYNISKYFHGRNSNAENHSRSSVFSFFNHSIENQDLEALLPDAQTDQIIKGGTD